MYGLRPTVYTQLSPRRHQYSHNYQQLNSIASTSVNSQNAPCTKITPYSNRAVKSYSHWLRIVYDLRAMGLLESRQYCCHCNSLRAHIYMRRSTCAYLNKIKNRHRRPFTIHCTRKEMHRDWLSAGADCAPVLVESIPACSDTIVPTILVLRQPLLLYSENVT